MRNYWIKLAVGVGLWVVIALAGFGAAVWQLWNLLMPELFGLKALGYWQACGLMALSWLLFGGWRWPGRSRARHGRMQGRVLTPEQRGALGAAMKARCEGRSV